MPPFASRLRLTRLARRSQVCRSAAARGPPSPATSAGAPAFLLGDGAPLTAPQLPRFLRYARLVATSLEGNAGLCRGLLRTRYDLKDEAEEEVAA